MDRAIISGCLIAFALVVLGLTIHVRHGLSSAMMSAGDRTVEAEECQQDHITTALRNLANGKFRL